jgi:hypothetical protein
MTRPPNKRVSRGRPVRTAGAPAQPSGCRGKVSFAAAVALSGLLMMVGQWHAIPLAWLVHLHVSLSALTPRAARHHPAAVGAGTGAAVGGTAGGSPTYLAGTR